MQFRPQASSATARINRPEQVYSGCRLHCEAHKYIIRTAEHACTGYSLSQGHRARSLTGVLIDWNMPAQGACHTVKPACSQTYMIQTAERAVLRMQNSP